MGRRFGRHGMSFRERIAEFVHRYKAQCTIGILACIAVVVIVLIAAHAQTAQNYQESFIVTDDTIKIGIRTDGPAFGQVDESGQITGFNRDLIDAILERMIDTPKIYEYVPLSSQDAGAAIKYGDAQICIGQLVPGTTQTSGFELTAPYYTDVVVALVPESSRIEQVTDLENGIGVLATAISADQAAEQLEELGLDIPLTQYSDYESALTDLAHSRINAVLMPYTTARRLQELGYRVLAEPIYEIDYCIMLGSGQTAVSQQMSRIISDMLSDGTITALRSRWNV